MQNKKEKTNTRKQKTGIKYRQSFHPPKINQRQIKIQIT